MRVLEIGRSRVVFEYGVTRESDGVTAARAVQTTVAVDPVAWRSVAIPESIRGRLLSFRAPNGERHG
jgi:acyl-CoA thioesterase FadM